MNRYQSSQDELIAKKLNDQVKDEEKRRLRALRADEALAQKAEAERLEEEKALKEQTEKDEKLALKYQEANDAYIAKQVANTWVACPLGCRVLARAAAVLLGGPMAAPEGAGPPSPKLAGSKMKRRKRLLPRGRGRAGCQEGIRPFDDVNF